MRENYSEIEKLIVPVVQSFGYEFIGSEKFIAGKQSTLRVYIDRESGVDLDDCCKISEQLDAVFDVESPGMREKYTLEISSPGLERRLFTVGQLVNQVGNKVKLKLYAPLDGRRKFVGTLKEVLDASCTITLDEVNMRSGKGKKSRSKNKNLETNADSLNLEKTFNFEDIDEVRVVPELFF